MALLPTKRTGAVSLAWLAPRKRRPRTIRPLPTLDTHGAGPLRRLAWIFGLGR